MSMFKVKQYSSSLDIWKAWCNYNFEAVKEDAEEVLFSVIWGNSLIRRKKQAYVLTLNYLIQTWKGLLIFMTQTQELCLHTGSLQKTLAIA